jgi:hypothetical protein
MYPVLSLSGLRPQGFTQLEVYVYRRIRTTKRYEAPKRKKRKCIYGSPRALIKALYLNSIGRTGTQLYDGGTPRFCRSLPLLQFTSTGTAVGASPVNSTCYSCRVTGGHQEQFWGKPRLQYVRLNKIARSILR